MTKAISLEGVKYTEKDLTPKLNDTSIKHIIDSVKTTTHCQRNWDYTQPVTDKDLNTIIEACTNMPTKQNAITYELFIVKNKEKIKKIYEYSAPGFDMNDDTEVHWNELPNFSKPENISEYYDKIGRYQNGQVNAPTVLLWTYTSYSNFNDFNVDSPIDMGISAGVAGLMANILGYRTGFCACIDGKKLVDLLGENSSTITEFGVAMGIGKPKIGVEHNKTFLNETFLSNLTTYKKHILGQDTEKPIPVHYI